MIIDNILDSAISNIPLNIAYIKDEAEIFCFDYILQAIETKNAGKLKIALARYIKDNNYNTDIIIYDLKRLKIIF